MTRFAPIPANVPLMGATMVYPYDLYPYVVTHRSESGRVVWIQPLSTEGLPVSYRVNGFPVLAHVYSDAERTSANIAGGEPVRVSLRKDGKWRVSGTNYAVVSMGTARYRRDFSQ